MTVVAITGTSSGMGEASARYLGEREYRIYGGNLPSSRGVEGAGVRSLPLDVRDSESVTTFFRAVLDAEGRIDALVNNAGFGLAGAVEETSLEEARDQLETNFFGVVRMCQAALPILRSQGAGKIVNVSSGAGLTAGPFHAFYSASKFAVEGFTEALRHEVSPFGVSVSLLEPGSFRTRVIQNGKLAARRLSEYAPRRDRCLEAVRRYSEEGPDPVHVAKTLHRILRARRPGLRYRVGTDVTLGYFFRRLLPERWFQPMVAKHYRI